MSQGLNCQAPDAEKSGNPKYMQKSSVTLHEDYNNDHSLHLNANLLKLTNNLAPTNTKLRTIPTVSVSKYGS